jgi:hypothetical protein
LFLPADSGAAGGGQHLVQGSHAAAGHHRPPQGFIPKKEKQKHKKAIDHWSFLFFFFSFFSFPL